MNVALPAGPALRILDEGFTVLSDGGPNPIADIVLVHGLGGHPQSTWTTSAELARASAEPRRSKASALRRLFPWPRRQHYISETNTTDPLTILDEQYPICDGSGAEDVSRAVTTGPKEQGASSSCVVFWPKALMAEDFKNVRILTFGYESTPRRSTQHNLFTLSQSLLSRLADERVDYPERPIIFICHSLGGILTKFALKISQNSGGAEERLKSIRQSTRVVIFFATPHSGSDLASWGELLAHIGSIFTVTNTKLLSALNAQNDNGQLEELRKEFHKMLGKPQEGRIQVVTFRETKPMSSLPGTPVAKLVVPLASAEINSEWAEIRDLNSNHRDICKFRGPDDPKYKDLKITLKRFLHEIIHEPAVVVDGRHAAGTQVVADGQTYEQDERNSLWLARLRLTDPRDDKTRIKAKDYFLDDLYKWILDHQDFCKWQDDEKARILWIKGGAGKGKTMLLIGIIEELKELMSASDSLAFFFCQGTDDRLRNATAVLRGLIYLLLVQHTSLIRHLQTKYHHVDKLQFDNENAFHALSEVFQNILNSPIMTKVYLVVDALDECEEGLSQLLDLIARTSSATSSRVKWIVSSRPTIKASLTNAAGLCLSLEVNAKLVSEAIGVYIDYKVSQLEATKVDRVLGNKVRERLREKADGTFLWVALVFKKLYGRGKRDMMKILEEIPGDLTSLYDKTMSQISGLEYSDPELCRLVLSATTLAYRPLYWLELPILAGLQDEITNLADLERIINLCGLFLIIREDYIYFIHQSAKDYLITTAFTSIFPSGAGSAHSDIFSRSLQVLSRTLQQDIYSLRYPGFLINNFKNPDKDLLAPLRYSCSYWVSHLNEVGKNSPQYQIDIGDGGTVHSFLRSSLIHWLEALGWMGKASEGIHALSFLEKQIPAGESPTLHAFIHDAKRFALYNRSVIEQAPLQLYCSALVFAPEKSIIREQFEKCIPPWIQTKPKVQANWNNLLQTLEGHSGSVSSVAFSPDGKQVVSGSDDATVRLWDAVAGTQLQTLEGHSGWVSSVAFSPDGKQVVSGSGDTTVRLWDAVAGTQLQTLEGHSGWVRSVAFSPDGKQVVSGSDDATVRLWDAVAGTQLLTLEGHSDWVSSVAFSPDGKQVVSGSRDTTVRLWDAVAGTQLQTLEGHSGWVRSVAFSPDGKQVVSGSRDATVRLWDAVAGTQLQTLEGHSGWVSSVAFSPDGKQVVSGSRDTTVRLWDAVAGTQLLTLEGHSGWVWSVAFSPDGKQVVSGSDDATVRLWDAVAGTQLLTLEGHSDWVSSVAFSPGGKQVVSGSRDTTVRLWDAVAGTQLQTLEGHSGWVRSVAFSPDGKQVVSGSDDATVRLWDAVAGTQLLTLEGHSGSVWSVAFSPDGKLVPPLLISNDWVVEGGAKILWLPLDYRSPSCVAVWNGNIVLGYSSGRISILGFQKGSKVL